jgi:hypothetical protein
MVRVGGDSSHQPARTRYLAVGGMGCLTARRFEEIAAGREATAA